jgi:hypothetical protein
MARGQALRVSLGRGERGKLRTSPTNAEKKPVDSSTRNPLILLGLKRSACGLRPLAESEGTERSEGQREKWAPNRPWGGEGEVRKRSQEPAGVRSDPRD